MIGIPKDEAKCRRIVMRFARNLLAAITETFDNGGPIENGGQMAIIAQTEMLNYVATAFTPNSPREQSATFSEMLEYIVLRCVNHVHTDWPDEIYPYDDMMLDEDSGIHSIMLANKPTEEKGWT